MGFFCPDDAPQQSTSTSTSTIPQYLQDFGESQVELGDQLSQTPFAAYPGQLVEGFSGPQQQAFDAVQANQGNWLPQLEAAGASFFGNTGGSYSSRPGGVTPGYGPSMAGSGGVQAYMNPYLDTVREGVNRSFDQSQMNQDASVTQAGALGGDRRGIYDAEISGQRARALGDVDAAAYDQGADRFFQDAARQGALASMTQQMAANDVNQLQGIGAQQQNLGQANIDANYGQFMREYNHPFDMMNVRQSSVSGVPYATSTTSSGTAPGAQGGWLNTLGGLAGIGGGIGSLFSSSGDGTSAISGFTDWWNS